MIVDLGVGSVGLLAKMPESFEDPVKRGPPRLPGGKTPSFMRLLPMSTANSGLAGGFAMTEITPAWRNGLPRHLADQALAGWHTSAGPILYR